MALVNGGELRVRALCVATKTILLILVTAVAFSGCARKDRVKPGVVTTEPVELTIWRAADSHESFERIIEQYRSERPNVNINYVHNPAWKNDPELYLKDTIEALATGKGPDIWSVRNDWLPGQINKMQAAANDVLSTHTKDENLKNKNNTEFIREAFVPVVGENVVFGDKVYGLPLSVDSLALYLNTDMMEDVGVEIENKNRTSAALMPEEVKELKTILVKGPKNWTEVMKIVPYITVRQGTTITRAAIAMGLGKNIEQAPNIISSLLLQNNTKIVTDDNSAANFQNSTETAGGTIEYPGQGAIKFYTYFSNPRTQVYSWNEGDFTQGARRAFMNGQLAMIIEDSSFYATLKASNIKFGFSVVNMPQINPESPRSYANYWVETVTNNSRHPEIAWDFLIKSATTNAVGGYLSNTKRPPALKEKTGEYDEGASDLDVFKGQAQAAESWYKGAEPNIADQIFRNWADNIALSGMSQAEATNTAASQLTSILQNKR